jgi:hypothetical protein
MPSPIRLITLATLPETRRFVAAAARSDGVRDLVRRARGDRVGLLRDLANPAVPARLVRDAVTHPATRELAGVGLVFLPGRYLPVGWAATRLLRRALDRSGRRSASDGGGGGLRPRPRT